MSVSNIIEVTFGGSTLVFTEPYYKFNSGMYYKFTDLDLPEFCHLKKTITDRFSQRI